MSTPTSFLSGDISIEYQLSGDPAHAALLFVHGLGTDLRQFARQHEHFASRYCVVSVSLRGHGGSVAARRLTRAELTLRHLAGDVLALLDHLGLATVHYIGNSLGGDVGYELLGLAAQRLASLVTFGTTAVLAKSPLSMAMMALSYRLMSMKTMGKLASSAAQSADAGELTAQMIGGADKHSILGLIPHLGRFDYRPAIRDSQVPALIIRADGDTGINALLDSTIEVFEARGNFQLVELPDAGHLANLDQPDAFNQIVEAFVAAREDASGRR